MFLLRSVKPLDLLLLLYKNRCGGPVAFVLPCGSGKLPGQEGPSMNSKS